MRGVKFGGVSAICFAVVTPINNLIRHEPMVVATILSGSALIFCLSGVVGTFTDKWGSDVGDA